MKTQAQIKEEMLRLESKIEDAKFTGKGYNTFSQLRSDETRINTLCWVLDLPTTGETRGRKK
jgi:hypothetical protein